MRIEAKILEVELSPEKLCIGQCSDKIESVTERKKAARSEKSLSQTRREKGRCQERDHRTRGETETAGWRCVNSQPFSVHNRGPWVFLIVTTPRSVTK